MIMCTSGILCDSPWEKEPFDAKLYFLVPNKCAKPALCDGLSSIPIVCSTNCQDFCTLVRSAKSQKCTYRSAKKTLHIHGFIFHVWYIQCNPSIRTPLKRGYLDTIASPKFLYLTTLEMRTPRYSLICPNGVRFREVPLYCAKCLQFSAFIYVTV